MNKLPKGACKILRTSVPREASTIIHLVNRWLTNSGCEWTVTRLKAIRTGTYQLIAGRPDIAKQIWQSNSICYNHRTNTPKGVFGRVATRLISARNPSVIRRLDSVLRIYTCIRVEHLTHAQLKKAKGAINSPFSGLEDIRESSSRSLYKFANNLLVRGVIKANHFKQLEPSELRIDLSKLGHFSNTHHENMSLPREMLGEPYVRHVRSLWTSVYLPETLAAINPAETLRSLLIKSGAENMTCGHISFIQEGGCKARVVAVPNVWIQLMMARLDDSLDKVVKSLPQSCAHDQNKGAYFLKKTIEDGHKAYCFDLSSATDRFPLELQLSVLRGFGLDDYASAIHDISRGQWKARYVLKGQVHNEIWSYACGQPMGMYSSFKLFHLTHILLLELIARKLGADPECFCILGDDVIINHPKVADYYRSTLECLGVEVSPTKSIQSNEIGEFAGFVARKTNRCCTVHRPLKYSGKYGFGDGLAKLYALGSKVKTWSKWYRDMYDHFSHTIAWRNPDLSPLLPRQDDDSKPVKELNSHLLGSLSNKISYFRDYEIDEHVQDVFENQQIILLGQKERVNSEGFASANDNVDRSYGTELEDVNFENVHIPRVGLASDPLIKEQIELDRCEPLIESDNDVPRECESSVDDPSYWL